MTTGTATKIVIVAGQEFGVPAETDNEQIRRQLVSMGFTDAAGATIQKGTREGVDTIEFVKKAGTKGLYGVALARLLATVPPADAPRMVAGLSASQRRLLGQLLAGDLRLDQALTLGPDIREILDVLTDGARDGTRRSSTGARLCAHVDSLPAVAATAPSAW